MCQGQLFSSADRREMDGVPSLIQDHSTISKHDLVEFGLSSTFAGEGKEPSEKDTSAPKDEGVEGSKEEGEKDRDGGRDRGRDRDRRRDDRCTNDPAHIADVGYRSTGKIDGTPDAMIATGAAHCAALSVYGRVYTWGEALCGQLGHGKPLHTQRLPLEVTELPDCQAVACGDGPDALRSLFVMLANEGYPMAELFASPSIRQAMATDLNGDEALMVLDLKELYSIANHGDATTRGEILWP